MAVASERTREEARKAVRKLEGRQRTRMSKWLSLAHQIFQSCPATLRHAILLTDGQNGTWARTRQGDRPVRGLSGATAGVGTDWQVSELRKISAALLGTVDIVPDPAGRRRTSS